MKYSETGIQLSGAAWNRDIHILLHSPISVNHSGPATGKYNPDFQLLD